jgi:NADPH2:quinone reductase
MYVKGISLHSVLMLIPLFSGLNRDHYGRILFEIKKLVEAGKIKPLLHSEVFDWTQISKAHALLESGQNRGKIAVSVG